MGRRVEGSIRRLTSSVEAKRYSVVTNFRISGQGRSTARKGCLVVKKSATNSVLLMVSISLAVLLGELIVRIILPQNLSGSLRVQTEAGLSLNKSIGQARHQLAERVVYYHFSPPHIRDSQLKENTIQILTLGDSFTFGWLLDKKDTYVYLLQEYTDARFGEEKFNFINAATVEWGTADYVAYVEDFGKRINPDIILVFLNYDDIGSSIKRDRYKLENNNDLILRRNTTPVSSIKKFANSIPGYEWLLEHSHLFQLLRTRLFFLLSQDGMPTSDSDTRGEDRRRAVLTARGQGSWHLDINPEDAIRLGQALFLRLKNWCEVHGAVLYVVTTHWHYPYYDVSPEPTRAFMSTADGFFSRLGVPYFDASSEVFALRQSAPEKYALAAEDHHPNEAGSKLIADYTWPFLKDQLAAYLRRRQQ